MWRAAKYYPTCNMVGIVFLWIKTIIKDVHYKYNGSTNYYVYLEILTDMYLLLINTEMYLL